MPTQRQSASRKSRAHAGDSAPRAGGQPAQKSETERLTIEPPRKPNDGANFKGSPPAGGAARPGLSLKARLTAGQLVVAIGAAGQFAAVATAPVVFPAAAAGAAAIVFAASGASAQATGPWSYDKDGNMHACTDNGDGTWSYCPPGWGEGEPEPPPPPPPTYGCWDGSVVTDPALCPAQPPPPPPPTYGCWDGSVVTDPALCPAQPPPPPPPTYGCWDGSTVSNPAFCPADPCDGVSAPSISLSPSAITLATGESRNSTVSVSNGSVYYQSGGTRGTYSYSGGTLSYTATGAAGSDSVTVYAQNACYSATASLSITVLAAPTPPTAGNANLNVPYNTQGALSAPVGGSWNSVSVLAAPAHGTASFSGSTLNYTPTAGYVGPDSLVYEASGSAGSATGTISITVAPPAAPTANNANVPVAYDNVATGSVTATGQDVAFAMAANAAHGYATVASNGAYTYTPNPGYIGPDFFTFSATNPGGFSTGTINLTVAAPAAPIVVNDSKSTAYNQPVTFTLAASGAVTNYAVSNATGGSASLAGSSVTFTPNAGFVGVGGIDYTASGPGGVSNVGHININVSAPGAPVLLGGSATTEEGQPVTFSVNASGVFTAIEGYSAPAHGSLVIAGSNVTYTPQPGFLGSDNFDLIARGIGSDSAPATFSVNVVPPPPPPPGPDPVTCADGSLVVPPNACPVVHPDPGLKANPGEGATQVNTPIAVNLMRLIQGAPVETLDVVEQAKNGVVEVDSGEALYTPQEDFVGTDQFVYRATARNGQSAQAIVTVVVEGAVPVVTDVRIEVVGGVPFTVDLAQAADGGPFEGADLVDEPKSGSATFNGTVMTYTAPADFAGEARMRFAIRNKFGSSEPANLIATVLAGAVPAKELRATVLQGKEVRVDLTEGAFGGPFTAATLAAFDAQTGNARIEQEGDKFYLVYSSKGAFSGLTRVGFTLSNARTVSAMAFVSIEVTERENPALNKDVAGLVNSQTATANRMGDAQLSNVLGRLERMHNGRRENGLSVAFPVTREIVARDEEAKRDFAAELDQAFGRGEPLVSAKGLAGRGEASAVSVWAGGAIDLGHARGAERRSKTKFTTSGLSAGVDAPIGDTVVLGAGFGFGKDESKIGDKGTKSDASSISFFGYGSYQPGRATFLDAVLGVSKIDFDSQRYIDATGAFVVGSRRGDQVFGAISAGWEHQGPRLMISPYGRLQFVFTDLRGYVEQGDDTYALAFFSQKASDVTGALGVRGQLRYDLEDGTLLPVFRLEYRQKLHSGGAARMRYADWADSPIWSLKPDRSDDQSVVLGAGSTYQRGDWTIGAEVEHTAGDNGGKSTRLRVNGSTKF